MNCPKCGTSNNYYHTFCYLCGKKLPLPDKRVLPAEEPCKQPAAARIVLNTEPSKKGRKSGFNRKAMLYSGLSVLGVSFVVMFTLIVSNASAKQSQVFSPTPLPAASPAPMQPTEKVVLHAESLRIETDQESYPIKIVSASTAKIKINGAEIKSTGNGFWMKEVPLIPGENQFKIEAQCQGFLSATETVKINRVSAPPKLILDSTIPIQTNLSSLKITGTVEPNAALSTSLPIANKPAVDAQGRFQLVVLLPVIPAEYAIEMKAVARGKETIAEHKVTRLLNEKEYRAAAKPVTYTDLIAHPEQWKGKVLELTGTVNSVASSAQGNKVFTLLMKGNRTEIIQVEYNGPIRILKGVKRRLYCDLKEVKNGQPVVIARMAFRDN